MKRIAIMIVMVLMPIGVFAQNNTGRLQAKQVVTEQLKAKANQPGITVSTAMFISDPSGLNVSSITPTGFAGVGSGLLRISSVAVGAVYTEAILNSAVTDAKIADVAPGKVSAGTFDEDVFIGTVAANSINNAAIISVNASKINGLDVATTTYKTFGGYNGTLGTGTTFFNLTPTQEIILTRIVVNLTESGEGGAVGTVWKCGSTASNMLSITSDAAAIPGSSFMAVGAMTVGAGVKLSGWMDTSDESITPSANVICEYK